MYSVSVDHPTDDPTLVSYVRPELIALSSDLERVNDCYTMMRSDAVKKRYLFQEPGEPDAAFESRLSRSTYTPVFRDSIRAFAGLLGNYQESELPETLEDNIQNVDMMGSSLSKFLNELDQLVLRDGGAAVLVEMPQEQEDLSSALEEMEEARRPYLVHVERCNIVNWRTTMSGGREMVEQCVIRTLEERPSDQGTYGTSLEPVYVHLFPGGFKKYELVRGANNSKWTQKVIAEGQTSLPVVPMVWMGATGSKFGVGSVPLVGLADLSIQHFQIRSDLAELLHKCAMPVPVRRGAPVDAHGRPAPLTIGPNTAIDLPNEGDFSFAEPSGSSLQRHQEEIMHVESLMDRSSLNFMYGQGGSRTATEAALQGSQIQAQIKTLIENKESAVDMIVRLWSTYTNEKISDESGIEVSDSLIQRPLEAGEVQAYLNLFGESAISHQTLLEELQRGKALSNGIDVEEELKRIAEEKERAMEENLKQMERMGAMGGPEDDAPEPAAQFQESEKDQDPRKDEEAKANSKSPGTASAVGQRAAAKKGQAFKKEAKTEKGSR